MRQQRHTEAEVAAKLEKAKALIAQGKLNTDIAKALGVSVMTYHRWRKRGMETNGSPKEHAGRIRELQLENSRLRRVLTDLLLEKMNLEEVMHGHSAEVRASIRR